jgi:hypothetical protein
LLTILIVVVSPPAWLGSQVIFTVQLPPEAIVPQLFVCEKLAVASSYSSTELIVSGAEPLAAVLETSTVMGRDMLPTVSGENETSLVERLTTGPYPTGMSNKALCDRPDPASSTVSVA